MKESTAKLAEAIGEIHDRYVTEAEGFHISRRTRFLRWGTLAASLVLIAGVVLTAALTLPHDTPGGTCDYCGGPSGLCDCGMTVVPSVPDTEPLPTYDGAYLTADQLAGFVFNLKLEGATNAYTTVYAPDAATLNLAPLPTDDYAVVWRYTPVFQALDEDELKADIAAIYPRLESMLGVTIPALSYETDSEDGTVTAEYEWNSIRYNILATQRTGNGSYDIFHTRTDILIIGDYLDTVDINGRPIEVDQRLSDEEILASLADVRDALFSAFGQSFSAAKVERKYDGYSQTGVKTLVVTYYDPTDYPDSGDRIEISFDNAENFDGDTVSATILRNCNIRYTHFRASLANAYTPEARCRLLSLAEAEALLDAGYVFGGHVCPLCMEMQSPVSFDEYDFVTMIYVTGDPSDTGSALSVPFYAFYKDIGEAKNGNRAFARTLVPAVEVSGLEEYFEMQKQDHGNGIEYEEALPSS